jgi:hypothetical protein
MLGLEAEDNTVHVYLYAIQINVSHLRRVSFIFICLCVTALGWEDGTSENSRLQPVQFFPTFGWVVIILYFCQRLTVCQPHAGVSRSSEQIHSAEQVSYFRYSPHSHCEPDDWGTNCQKKNHHHTGIMTLIFFLDSSSKAALKPQWIYYLWYVLFNIEQCGTFLIIDIRSGVGGRIIMSQ